ncbi:lamin-B receptor [Mytilus galloprovincialis]|uniref:Lamin-B receptor n=1 Tax=Mytilus galloprovincialis TaxID=29158 RepID=A0A8B6FME9_MYTGA|nr:lamin-B receptor [Mytilus galloprovincialis]
MLPGSARQRTLNKPKDKADKSSTDDNTATSKTAVFFTLFFTSWIFVIVEKCITGNWSILTVPRFPNYINRYIDIKTFVILTGWFGLQCILYMLPVGGESVDGLQIKDSRKRLKYRLNAFFVLTVNIIGFFIALLSGIRVTSVSDKLLQLTTSGVLLIFLFSIVLNLRAGKSGKTGNSFNNWFNGVELNPRWGLFDLKYVCFRSGIIGWILMNFINISKAFDNGDRPSVTLLIVAGFQLLYVADYFWFEDGILVSRDIVHEHLGYNLLVQFLMIPFCFAVQTRYLMMTKYELPWYCLLAVSILNLIGYWIYRGSNSEKNNFRKNPDDPQFANYEVIPTSTGKNLLVSGWWGLCRHPNYLGDLIISMTYALPNGFSCFLPYLNPLFLFVMLVGRERTDGDECRKRYGEAWETYCHRVKYRIIPYVY